MIVFGFDFRRSPLGLRGLKYLDTVQAGNIEASRSPLGLRGLKCYVMKKVYGEPASQPSWAAWIEIAYTDNAGSTDFGRSPLGLRGLKSRDYFGLPTGITVAALLGCVD